MATMLPDIVSNYPKSEEMRLLIFDYFIDNHTSRPTGIWPVALIGLIERS
jgi:hypothetical protein